MVARPNNVLREVLREFPHVQRLPFYALTRPRWRWHFGNCTNRPTGWGGAQCCDCTHFCFSPGMWQAHLHDVKRILRRSLGAGSAPAFDAAGEAIPSWERASFQAVVKRDAFGPLPE